MSSANASGPPLTRGKKRAAEAEEKRIQEEAETGNRQQRMLQPQKIMGTLPTGGSGMVTHVGPNDIIVSRRNPRKIKTEEEVEEKPTAMETSTDEIDMEVKHSTNLSQNPVEVKMEVVADSNHELRSGLDAQGSGEAVFNANVNDRGICTRCQELEKIGSEKDLKIKKLELELEALKQKYEDPISKLCLEVDAKDARSKKVEKSINPIHLAISEGKSKEEIQRLVESEEKWDVPNADGDTVLHLAAKHGSQELIEYLISICDQLDVNKVNSSGSTPLMEAAEFSKDFLEVSKILIKHGADLEKTDGDGLDVVNLAIEAGRSAQEIEEIVKSIKNWDSKYLLGFGLDDSSYGPRLLHVAVENGNLEAVKYFLSLNANVNALEDWGDTTPLMRAASAKQNFRPIVDVLLENGADITLENGWGYNALHHIIERRRSLSDLKKLICAGAPWNTANDEETVLHVCAKHGHAEAMKYFIEKGADVNAQDMNGKRPKMIAAKRGMCDAMKVLIVKGAKFEAPQLLDGTLTGIRYHISEDYEFQEKSLCATIKKLVELGAISEDNESRSYHIDSRDDGGKTPLMRTILG